ncbi:MAG: anaerobic ribonucleoside-triphosphate reductase activating protein [Solobacterium sp.]|nr:anaerobic ribonucleoside-triphosphate reductase activating protein [Solobacterium sp.]
MAEQKDFILNLSVLYRNTQKYFDRVLVPYDIGSGQLIFLLCINENEGMTMQEVTNMSEVDKGTTTKSIQRLIDQGYVQIRIDEKDHRVKRLYTTQKAADIMNTIYEYRNMLRSTLAQDMDFETFEKMLAQASDNARDESLYEGDVLTLKIGELQKMSLGEYPGKMSCSIMMSGCNFKCPYCNKRSLVFLPENYSYQNTEEVMNFLKRRNHILDGVCISGGEPLMQEDLPKFIRRLRRLGYRVKLDTNGFYPLRLQELMEKKQVDYIALDVKNTKDKYALTTGMHQDTFSIQRIEDTLALLKASKIEYECRTTVVKEFHTKEDLVEIAKWIGDVKHYYLQFFEDNEEVIQRGLTAYTKEEMFDLLEAVREVIPHAEIRGMKG